jgi:hypothetical protein
VKKQYFFGYLFVRCAKLFAFLVIAAGIGFCLLEYSQAKTATAAVVYQPSQKLQQALRKLQEDVSATVEIVDSFDKDNETTGPAIEPPAIPAVIDSNDDFERVSEELLRINQDRQDLKQSVVNRFETSVANIQEKLRTYAASLDSSRTPGTRTTAPSPAIASVLAVPTRQQNTFLFSPKLDAADIKDRRGSLAQRREFLKFLESKAENAENRAILNQAANQMDQLSKLLPEKTETSVALPSGSVLATNDPSPEQNGSGSLSERVAGQLEQLRSEVGKTLLTSWKLDDAFDQANELTSVEREKCRVATLRQQGIWLAAGSKMLPGLFVAALLSFLVLVFADLVRTLLDTAANTGTVAEAVNALRGSFTLAVPTQRESVFVVHNKEDKHIVEEEEETSVAGGS